MILGFLTSVRRPRRADRVIFFSEGARGRIRWHARNLDGESTCDGPVRGFVTRDAAQAAAEAELGPRHKLIFEE